MTRNRKLLLLALGGGALWFLSARAAAGSSGVGFFGGSTRPAFANAFAGGGRQSELPAFRGAWPGGGFFGSLFPRPRYVDRSLGSQDSPWSAEGSGPGDEGGQQGNVTAEATPGNIAAALANAVGLVTAPFTFGMSLIGETVQSKRQGRQAQIGITPLAQRAKAALDAALGDGGGDPGMAALDGAPGFSHGDDMFGGITGPGSISDFDDAFGGMSGDFGDADGFGGNDGSGVGGNDSGFDGDGLDGDF